MKENQGKENPSYRDLGFAKVDHHRAQRTGFAEVIFGQGKTREQICDIFVELMDKGHPVIATRTTSADYEFLHRKVTEAVYYDDARIIALPSNDQEILGSVAVVSAGTADMPVAEEAAVTAELLGNRVDRVYDVGVAGLHRLLDHLDTIESADVVIAVAGMEGALASVVGGLVEAPVIAVPTSIGYGANLEGISALLSMLNSCANGVATVNIDNGFGAGYMAAAINRRHRP